MGDEPMGLGGSADERAHVGEGHRASEESHALGWHAMGGKKIVTQSSAATDAMRPPHGARTRGLGTRVG